MQTPNQMSTWPRIAVVATAVFVAPFAHGGGIVAQPRLVGIGDDGRLTMTALLVTKATHDFTRAVAVSARLPE